MEGVALVDVLKPRVANTWGGGGRVYSSETENGRGHGGCVAGRGGISPEALCWPIFLFHSRASMLKL